MVKNFLIDIKNSFKIGKRIGKDPYFRETRSKTKIEIQKRPSRTEIINTLVEVTHAENYLEIGVRNPEDNFDGIRCENKYSVDPGIEFKANPVDFKMTSDAFFSALRAGNLDISSNIKFDVIFIDGLHLAAQVEKDLLNSLDFITDSGVIVLHDCNPPTEFHARESYGFMNSPAEGFWNGTTWKAFYKFRHRKDLHSACFDTDWGVGVVSKMKYPLFNSLDLPLQNPYFEFKDLERARAQMLNLIDFESWKKKCGK